MLAYSEEVLQVRSNCLILYTVNEYTGLRSETVLQKLRLSLEAARKSSYCGELKAGTKKRLIKAIDLLLQIAQERKQFNPVSGKTVRHRLSFITLTVASSENLTARVAYDKLFKHFLQWMRRTAGVRTYLWKVEQQARGQIHYHITTPSWIHYQVIRDKWNSLQRNAGLLEEFHEKYGHYDPNSTDIHEVRNKRDLSSYLIKEFSKSIQNPKTEGKVWDCSENLKAAKYFTFPMNDETARALLYLDDRKQVKEVTLEHCSIFKVKPKQLTQLMRLVDLKNYDEHIKAIRLKSLKNEREKKQQKTKPVKAEI